MDYETNEVTFIHEEEEEESSFIPSMGEAATEAVSTEESTAPAESYYLQDDDAAIQEDEAGDEAPLESEESTEAQATDESTEETVTVNGETYKVSEIDEALKNFGNGTKWQADLTRQSQEIAEARKEIEAMKAELEKGSKEHLQNKEPELSEEERQTAEWLKANGFVTKEDLAAYQEKLTEIEQREEQERIAQVQEQIVTELRELQKSMNLSDNDLNGIINFAEAKGLQHLAMEDVYFLMNRDKVADTFKKQQEEESRISAAQDRRSRVSSVQSTRGGKTLSIGFNKQTDADMDVRELAMRDWDALED